MKKNVFKNLRAYFEFTWDGKGRFVILHQKFNSVQKSKVLFAVEKQLSERFNSTDCLNPTFIYNLKAFCKEINNKLANSFPKLKKKQKIGATIIFPTELIITQLQTMKIKNNFISKSGIERKINSFSFDKKYHLTTIQPTFKRIYDDNGEYLQTQPPKMFHNGNIEIISAGVDNIVYETIISYIKKIFLIGDLFIYDENKAIRKSFSFFRLPNHQIPTDECLIDWRDTYLNVEIHKGTDYFKYQVATGVEDLPTLSGDRNLTLGIYNDLLHKIKQEVLLHNKLSTNWDELQHIHYGSVNNIDSFNELINKISNHTELNFNFDKFIDYNGYSASKNILMFALNEKQEAILTYGDVFETKQELKDIQNNTTALGKITSW